LISGSPTRIAPTDWRWKSTSARFPGGRLASAAGAKPAAASTVATAKAGRTPARRGHADEGQVRLRGRQILVGDETHRRARVVPPDERAARTPRQRSPRRARRRRPGRAAGAGSAAARRSAPRRRARNPSPSKESLPNPAGRFPSLRRGGAAARARGRSRPRARRRRGWGPAPPPASGSP
jgi:hypothetical protein